MELRPGTKLALTSKHISGPVITKRSWKELSTDPAGMADMWHDITTILLSPYNSITVESLWLTFMVESLLDATIESID